MQVSVGKAALLGLLGRVITATEKKGSVPILTHVLVTAADGVLSMTGTDMEIALNGNCAAEVIEPGTTTMPAATMMEIVRKLPDGCVIKINAPASDDQATVTTGRFKTQLVTMLPEDFPSMALGSFESTFSISTAHLRKLIDRTHSAMSSEETRYYLCGIYLHRVAGENGPMLRAVSTDGHRLALVGVPMPANVSEDMEPIIIPRRTVAAIRRMLDDANPEMTMSISKTRIMVSTPDGSLTSKLIDGTYPDYERIIPNHEVEPIDIELSAFEGAIERVAAVGSEKTRAISITVEKGRVMLSMSDQTTGMATEEIDEDKAHAVGVRDLKTGFQARYLLDFTSQVQGKVRLMIGDGSSPMVAFDTAQPECKWLLMPMRV